MARRQLQIPGNKKGREMRPSGIEKGVLSLGSVELVDLCRQDEIALRQTVDLVRPGRDPNFSPSKRDIWVVTLFLRELAYAVYKLERFAKVGKREGLCDVVLLNHIPPVHLLFEGDKVFTLERRHSSSARYARLGREP